MSNQAVTRGDPTGVLVEKMIGKGSGTLLAGVKIEKLVLAFAGTVVLVSLSLGIWVHMNWFFLTAFVGLNLLQSSFTGFCPLAIILRKMGLQAGVAFK